MPNRWTLWLFDKKCPNCEGIGRIGADFVSPPKPQPKHITSTSGKDVALGAIDDRSDIEDPLVMGDPLTTVALAQLAILDSDPAVSPILAGASIGQDDSQGQDSQQQDTTTSPDQPQADPQSPPDTRVEAEPQTFTPVESSADTSRSESSSYDSSPSSSYDSGSSSSSDSGSSSSGGE